MLSERLNGSAATKFFAKALSTNGIPDKSGANTAGIRGINKILKRLGCPAKIHTIRSKYLNNMIEQGHRFIKRRIRHLCGFKPFGSALTTLEGIEVANMIRKRQFSSAMTSGFRLFTELAG